MKLKQSIYLFIKSTNEEKLGIPFKNFKEAKEYANNCKNGAFEAINVKWYGKYQFEVFYENGNILKVRFY